MCSLAIQLCTKHREYFLLEAPRKKEIARFGTKKIIISGPLCGCWWHNVFSLMAKHTWVVFLCWHIKYNIISCQTVYINALQWTHMKAKKRKMSKEKQGLCEGWWWWGLTEKKNLYVHTQTQQAFPCCSARGYQIMKYWSFSDWETTRQGCSILKTRDVKGWLLHFLLNVVILQEFTRSLAGIASYWSAS